MSTVPEEIVRLVAQFDEHRDAYGRGDYNETQLRRDYLDPFFAALGWDVHNRQGYAEAYRDVIHEDSLRVEKTIKAPDYGFRVGGARKFFVEAKRPAVDVRHDAASAFQLRRYAWTAKLPLSILTNFEHLAVYDCRVKPDKDDKASTARILLFTHREYADRWDDIAGVLSREAILHGAFDKFAQSTRKKRGTAEVDEAFLEEIESWREVLARNLSLRNERLSDRDLNFAVQRIIDRVIFLRMCEGRGIEPFGQLQSLLGGPNVYPRLVELFHRADEKYNAGLFHFQPEKGREPPDELTTALAVDDKTLKDILVRLYYPESPYEFAALPADILGQVYEQFLGKVIRLTAGHRAKVEEKPEVRKAGGVYYTPTYIVEYIVRNTVGRLVEGRSPQEVGGLTDAWRPSKTRRAVSVLDPACGSGSFLIVAYQFLLDWYLKQYAERDPEKHARGANPRVYQHRNGEWRLTAGERKRILLSHIYGVDVDYQAVEVTKLSLLLKVLEGETEETLERQRRLFHKERALPDLAGNIKCGNSLVGSDFYNGQQLSLLDEKERLRINVFDWDGRDGFPTVFPSPSGRGAGGEGGGFDAVIGNPPYGASLSEAEVAYLREKFTTANRELDSYCLFMEQAVRLARENGLVSMIVPTGWYSGANFSTLRRFMATHTDPRVFVNLPYDVFRAWVDTTMFVAAKRAEPADWPRRERCPVQLLTFPKRHRIQSVKEFEVGWRRADLVRWFAQGHDEYMTYADAVSSRLMSKLQQVGTSLGEVADVQRGVTPFALSGKPTHKSSRRAFAGTVRRYKLEAGGPAFVRFDDTLAEPKPERYFVGPRLLLRELISRRLQLQAVKATEDFVTNKSMQSILAVPGGPSLEYLLGILNSKLMSWYFLRKSNIAQRDDFPKIVLRESRALPVRPIDLMDRRQKAQHDRMCALVEQMLDLHRRLDDLKMAYDREAVHRQIDATDRQIDRLVYELYGLTEDEIRLVEEGTGSCS